MRYLIALLLVTACAPARDLGVGKDPIAYTNSFLQNMNTDAEAKGKGPQSNN